MTTKVDIENIILTIEHNHTNWDFIVGKLKELITDDGFEYEMPVYKRGNHCWTSPITGYLHHEDCTTTDEYGHGAVTRFDKDAGRQVIVPKEEQ